MKEKNMLHCYCQQMLNTHLTPFNVREKKTVGKNFKENRCQLMGVTAYFWSLWGQEHMSPCGVKLSIWIFNFYEKNGKRSVNKMIH